MLGKVVTDLQSDISIGSIAIGGTLKYVTGYTGYSGDVDLQEGNFIALHASADDGATITAEIIGGESGEKTLDSDGLVVARLTTNATSIRFKASKDGQTQVKEFNLISLVLEEDE